MRGASFAAAVALGVAFAACGNNQPQPGTTGGTGGTSTTGGTSGAPGTGGVGTGGVVASGGSGATGGSAAATGGSGGSGGSSGGTTGGTGSGASGGAGGSSSGAGGSSAGTPASGGSSGSGVGSGGSAGNAGSGAGGSMPGGGTASGGAAQGGRGSGGMSGAGGGGGTPGGSAGSDTSGTCQKGQTKPAEVVIMGESFYAIDPQYIQNRIQDDARKAGALGASDKYRNVAVSGQNMNYIATTEWTAATQGGASVKLVIMDGGGIDCLTGGSTCSSCSSTFQTLLGKMATAGVKDVIYTRYPEPGNPPGSNTSLKGCLDSTMPNMQKVCEASTSPVCHWVDLRPVWMNGDTSDGLHPTQSGGEHVGDLIWSEMVKDCLAQ